MRKGKIYFTEKLAEELSMTKTEAAKTYDTFCRIAGETLECGDDLVINGIGTLRVVEKPKRIMRNPNTGAPVYVKAKNVVKFIMSSMIKRKING